MKKYLITTLSAALITSYAANYNSDSVSAETYYSVKKGDSLYQIGQKFGVTHNELMKLNNMKNANIFVGQKLLIKKSNNTSNIVVASNNKIYKTKTNLNLRSTASTSGKVLLTIPSGKTVNYISTSGSWYKVTYNGKTGFVSSQYVSITNNTSNTSNNTSGTIASSVSYTYKTKTDLNMRKGAGTGYSKVLTIPKNKLVNYVSKSGKWFKVTYNGKTGWVSSDYITVTAVKKNTTSNTTTSTKDRYVTTTSLNMRKGAGTGYSVITTIPKNKDVTYLSKSGKWYKVTYNGKTGWVSSDYIKFIKGTTKTSTNTGSNGSNTGNTNPVKNEEKQNTTPNTPNPSGNNEVVTSPPVVIEKPVEETKPVVVENKKYVVTSSTGLNLRSKADINSSTLVTIPQGDIVEYLNNSEGIWYQVSYNGKTGWSSSLYLSLYDPNNVTVTEVVYYSAVNAKIYSKDSTSSTVLGTAPALSKMNLISKQGSFYKVKYNNVVGFVSTSEIITDDSMKRINDLEKNKNSFIHMDLRTQSSVTASQINNYINNWMKSSGKTNSVLNGKGQVFIDAGKKYGVNALYLAAHAVHESAYGTSTISLERNNLFGYGAYDLVPYLGAVKFSTIDENINFIAQMMKGSYLGNEWRNKGTYLGYTVKSVAGNRVDSLSKGMNFYYASDEKWGEKIAKHMTNMLTYENEGARLKSPNTTAVVKPSYPNYEDKFFSTTLAEAKGNITLYTSKSTSNKAGITLTKGQKFHLTVKDNNYWLTIVYNGKTYYASPSFSQYSSYFKTLNLGRVTTSSNTVRTIALKQSASTSSTTLINLNSGTFVQLELDSNNSPIISNGMYKVTVSGKTGWISTGSIIQDLK